MRSFLALSAILLIACSGVSARLVAEDGFDVQGVELLAGRYGAAYPGTEQFGFGAAPLNQWSMQDVGQQQQFGVAQPLMAQASWQQSNPALSAALMQQESLGAYNVKSNLGAWGSQNLNLGLGQSNLNLASANLNLGSAMGYSQLAYGGGLGSGSAGGSKKGQTTVAAPIYAQSMVVPKIITQPILRPHLIQQPILQQQLIQQPIVETRQVIQPVIRRIITQPIIKPQIYETTTIQPTLKQETIVQPHLIEQTVVTPTMQNAYEENQPIQEAPTTQQQQAVTQPVQSAKKGSSAVGSFGGMF